MRAQRKATIAATVATFGSLVCLAAPAPAQSKNDERAFAPLGRKGPTLSVPRSKLRASLTCTRNLRRSRKPPVLLLSGTTVDPDENFDWNWMPALTDAGYPWCASKAPDDNMADIQVRGEYVVYAIRRMHRSAGRRIAIFGHSQGGMVGRWALRFWPGTRNAVRDVVGAAPSNQGTESARFVCSSSCAPANWQQMAGSSFIRALNSRAETFRGISYTNIYSRLDVIVAPNFDDSGNSSLHTGRGRIANIGAQETCPGHLADHLTLGTVDPLAWALFLDAVTHPGPADPARIPRRVCSAGVMPGVDHDTVLTDTVAAAQSLASTILAYPGVPEEPPLRDYVFAR